MSAASVGDDVLVICGPTAAGKSAVGMWLAGLEPSTIISADSRQIYRGFDIGTAKPTADERQRVPHQGIDLTEPTARYSAAAWADAADRWIAESRVAGRRPLVVGGTGLYLRALFEGLFEEPQLDVERRRSLERELAGLSVAELRRWAEALDPARAHLGRTQLLRAVEIALLTGRRVSELHRDRTRAPRWRPRYLLVDPGPSLAHRIGTRIDAMLAHGWLDEVHRLMQTVPADAPAWKSTGYDAVREYLRGARSRDSARDAILIQTRQYAKRQRTWFRHQLPTERVARLDPNSPDWQRAVAAWAGAAVGAGAGTAR